MKKITTIVLCGTVVLVALAFVLSRTFLKQPSKSLTIPNGKLRIGFSLGDLREERWQKDRDLFVAEAEKLGAYVIVTSANSDSELQNTQIENLISQGVKVIVIAPHDGEKIAPVVELANKAGVKIIAYDRLIKNSNIDFYISFDNIKVGNMEALGVIAVKNTGNFAYVGGAPTDNNAKLLKQGAMEILNPLIEKGSIKLVVNEFSADWKPEEAYKTIKNYLTKGGKLDAIIAGNDGTAFGAIRALKEFKLDGKIPVSGQDAELAACQRIIEGTQISTVYKPISALAAKAADIAIALATGKKPETNNTTNNGKIDVPSFFLNPIMVNKETMDTTVIQDGFHPRSQVYLNSK